MLSFVHFNATFFFITTLFMLRVHALAVRDTTSDISTTKGGILVKNGEQTSCELGVIDVTAAFVAAPCLDFSGSEVNKNTKYEVYLDAGIDNTPATYTVSSITVHPDYNATMNLNPIAVLQFNTGGSVTWSNPIAINRNDSWDSAVFISRGLLDMNPVEWRTPLTLTNNNMSVVACTNDSYVYGENVDDLFCTTESTYPPYTYLTTCAIPYGSVDVYISDKLYIAGIYAYTALVTETYQCMMRLFQFSVYILFADYIAFASKVLGRSINYYPYSDGIAPQSDSDYSMKAPPQILTGLTKDGDLYVNQTDPLETSSSPGTTVSSVQRQTSSDSDKDIQGIYSYSIVLSDASGDADIILGDDQDASSKKIAIIGVICGILGGLVVTSLTLYLCKKWKRAHNNIYRDKDSGIDMQEMLVVDSRYIAVPPSIYIPHTSLPESSSLRSSPSTQTPYSGFDREVFEALEYYIPPPYEDSWLPSSSSKRDKKHRHP